MQCIATNDSAGFCKEEALVTYRKVYEGKSLMQMKTLLGEQELTKSIAVLFRYFLANLNISNSMNEDQIISMVSLMINAYPAETFEDFVMFIKQVKLGRFGPVYNRIDSPTVSNWFIEYLKQKQDHMDVCRAEDKSKYIEENKEVMNALVNNHGLKIEDTIKTQDTSIRTKDCESLERHINSIKENIDNYSDENIEDLIQDSKTNLHTANKDLISFLQTELEKRKLNKTL
jgi:hypothetical protein